MKRNQLFFISVFLLTFSIKAQQQLAFSFGESPQTLLLNPGAETNFSRHYGIPILSNFSLSLGSTGFVLGDLFLNDNRNFTSKFQDVLTELSEDDYININAKIDILNGGYRYDDRTYISFGFYQEVDIITYIPKDIAELFYYGNQPYLNRTFSFSQIAMKADIIGVLHAGISRKVDEKLNVGARVKIYSSSLNVESTNNSGTLSTFNNDQNILRQSLNNIDVQFRTSGLIASNDEFLENPGDLFSKTFFGGNLGLGLDLGLTYHFTPQIEFTGSILDFGFIRHSKNTRIYSAKGDFTFDGVTFEFDPDNPRDYWQELEDDFDDNVPTEETQDAYTSWRPMKINAAIKYSFGQVRNKACYVNTRKQYYYNAIGFQVHTIMRPLRPQFSFTSFFETSISEKIHTKFTHTINDYSAKIIGSGISLQIGKVHLFGLVDNILGVRNIATVENISFNFGINLVID